MLVALLNGIFSFLEMILGALISLLPDSPFQFTTTDWPVWAQVIGYIFPVQAMLAHFSTFLTAVGVWYGIRILARWLKAAGGS